jgi:hypothetical protein
MAELAVARRANELIVVAGFQAQRLADSGLPFLELHQVLALGP